MLLIPTPHLFYTKTILFRDKHNLLKPFTNYNFNPGIPREGLGQGAKVNRGMSTRHCYTNLYDKGT